MAAVSVHHLSKRYITKKETITAVNEISFDVSRGELFGIMGPDGAGKTSLFRMLTTLLLPDSGTAMVDDSDIVTDFRKIRQKVGYMPGRFSLYQDLTVEENLQFFATIFHTSVRENYDLIKDIYLQIEPFKNRRSGKLSGGMKQKLALCCALIHRPVVLFLDEPTTGVDAVSRKEFWEMLQRLKQQGITILVSTPYMDEAGLCDRVALVAGGRILSSGTPGSIIESFKDSILAVKARRMYPMLTDLAGWPGASDCYSFGEYHHVVIKAGFNEEQLRRFLEDKGHTAVEIFSARPDIEDCFMQLMQHL